MKRSEDNRAETITGMIELPDGSKSEFSISANGWQQWGAERGRLTRSCFILDAIMEGVTSAQAIVSDSDGDYEDE